MAKVHTQLVIDGKNNSKAAFDQVNSQLDSMNSKLSTAGKSLVGAFSVSMLAGAVRTVAQGADAYNLMNARLKLATGSQQEFNTASSELQRIATATQTPLESMVTLYGRISRPLKEAGRSQADILKVTEAVAQSFRISGATAEEAQNGVVQFAQALGSGALRGDEFNSVAEQAPRLMQALAAGIGVPVGALKEMASQGLLTADVVTTALTGQLDVLRAEAKTLPATVGGAMTELSDDWNAAVGQADVQPLIDAIKSLSDTVSDPAVVSGLVSLASAIATTGAVAVEAAAGVGIFAKDLGYIAARVSGNVDEISRADKEIEKLSAAANGIGILDLYMTDEQIAQRLKEWQTYRKALVDDQSGMSDDLRLLGEIAAGVADSARQAEIDAQTKYVGELKALQGQQLDDAKKAIKEQESLQKKAQTAKDRIATDRKAIDAKYDETKSALSGVGSGPASYAGAQALKVNARASLKAGDSASAIKQAEAARQVLLDLQAAGESTYGLAGFADELRGIEQAAKDIEATEADRKLLVIGLNIATLQAQADKLKNITVTPVMDDAAAASLTTALQALATSLGNTLTIPVKMVASGFAGDMGSLALTPGEVSFPGYATGTDNAPAGMAWVGENGPELMRFRGGEQVFPAGVSASLAANMSGLQIPRGGDLALREAALSAPVGQSGRDLGRVDLNIGGETISLLADQQNFSDLVKRQSWKRGSTRR